ncbi:hypothetical protein OAM08_01730 [Pelagibacteraceae bacterium]|nr:hypothetical protein [Pelagibacteraceae bacterium]
MNLNKSNFFYYFLALLILGYFISGLFFLENAAGGGNINELHHHWENFQIFLNNNFFDAIKLTNGGADIKGMTYDSSRSPLVPIVQAFFLSFFNVSKEFIPQNLFYFRFIVFLISLVTPFLFYLCLKKKFTSVEDYLLILLSFSVLLLSPYFRTSAYWGYAENYTFISMLLSYYFIFEFINNKKKIVKIEKKIIYVTLFSSLCVYFDIKAIIVPILCYYFICTSLIPRNKKIFTTILYLFFSLPYVYLVYLWESPIPPAPTFDRGLGNEIFIENVGYSISIIAFYLFPVLFFKVNSFQELKKVFSKKKIIYFVIISSIYLLCLNLIYSFDAKIFLGKGFLHKFVELFFEDQSLKILFTNIGFLISILILFLYIDTILDLFIILFFIFISLVSSWLQQEYFDPIMLLLIFTFFSTKIFIDNKKVLFLTAYQFVFLVGSILYYLRTLD